MANKRENQYPQTAQSEPCLNATECLNVPKEDFALNVPSQLERALSLDMK